MAKCVVCGHETGSDAPICEPSANRCEEWVQIRSPGTIPGQHRERYVRGWDAARKAKIARERRWIKDFEILISEGRKEVEG